MVDATRGLVAVDRNTVPVSWATCASRSPGRSRSRAASSTCIRCTIVAIVSFDPKLLDGTPIRSATLDPRELVPGESVVVVGLNSDSRVRSIATTVASVDDVSFPLSRTLQFREANLEVARLVNPAVRLRRRDRRQRRPRARALVELRRRERAATCRRSTAALPVELVAEAVAAVQRGAAALFARGRVRGRADLAGAQARACPRPGCSGSRPPATCIARCLSVARVVAGSPAAELLREGDLLLAVDGRPVSRFRDGGTCDAVAAASRVTVLRDGVESTLRRSHRGARRQRHRPPVALVGRRAARAASRDVGPARHPARGSLRRVLLVRLAVHALQAVCRTTHRRGGRACRRPISTHSSPPSGDRPDRSAVRLKTVTWNGTVEVITLKLDLHYWPSYELRRTPVRLGADARRLVARTCGATATRHGMRGSPAVQQACCRACFVFPQDRWFFATASVVSRRRTAGVGGVVHGGAAVASRGTGADRATTREVISDKG